MTYGFTEDDQKGLLFNSRCDPRRMEAPNVLCFVLQMYVRMYGFR